MALATLLLLLASSASGALDQRGDRITWRDMNIGGQVHPSEAKLHVLSGEDPYRDIQITRVLVAPLSDDAPVPPGLRSVPAPRQTIISPALRDLIATDPEVLGPRFYDGAPAGLIANDGLASSDELVAIVGVAAAEMPRQGNMLATIPSGNPETGLTVFLRILLIIGVVVLMLPVALFIAAAARLDAQNSDTRLAAFRLAGADPRQVRWLVAVESLAAAIPGVIVGFVAFFALRPSAANFTFDENRFYPADFALGTLSFAVLILVPVIAIAASFYGLRDVEISPLGVSRRSTKKVVRPFALPLLGGGFILYYYGVGTAGSTGLDMLALIGGIGAIMLGLALLGPWLGQFLARKIASRAGSGPILLAARRIVAEPHATFRTVSGVTFAVFAGTLFLSVTGAASREVERPDPGTSGRPEVFTIYTSDITPDIDLGPDAIVVDIDNMAIFTGPQGGPSEEYLKVVEGDCALIMRLYALRGECSPSGALLVGSELLPGSTATFTPETYGDTPARPETINLPADMGSFAPTSGSGFIPQVILPPGTIKNADAFVPEPTVVLPAKEGALTVDERERIRTAIIRAIPGNEAYTDAERESDSGSDVLELRNFVYAGIFASFAVSGATVALSVAGSIIARRQAFALLRLSGVSIGTLRRTVLTEATLPLLLVSFASAGLAVFLAIVTIDRAGSGSAMPPASFALPLFGGLAMGLVLTLTTLPLLGHVTSMERTRFD